MTSRWHPAKALSNKRHKDRRPTDCGTNYVVKHLDGKGLILRNTPTEIHDLEIDVARAACGPQ